MKTSQQKRQDIIDYLIRRPNSSAQQIAEAIGQDLVCVSGKLHRMRKWGHMRLTQPGRYGTWETLVTESFSDEELKRVRLESAGRANPVAVKQQPEPWRTVHIGGHGAPIQRQGGQGALRNDPRRGCSLS